MNAKRVLVIMGLGMVGVLAVGCSASRRGMDMPPADAYAQVQQQQRTEGILDKGIEIILPSLPIRLDEAERRLANCEKTALSTGVPARAFEEMLDEISQELADKLVAFAADRTNRGADPAPIVVCVGRFTTGDEINDGRLRRLLRSAEARLSRNGSLAGRVVFVQMNEAEAGQVIKEIGGGSELWLEPDFSNLEHVALKSYHPDSIFVLTGELDMFASIDRGVPVREFLTTVAMLHPRTKSSVPGLTSDFEHRYEFHVFRDEWLSEAQVSELKANQVAVGVAR